MIDRLIFLRMSEDRGVELYGQLQALLFKLEKKRAEAPDELTLKLLNRRWR